MKRVLVIKIGNTNILIKPRIKLPETKSHLHQESNTREIPIKSEIVVSVSESFGDSARDDAARSIQIRALNYINHKRCKQRNDAACLIQNHYLNHLMRKFEILKRILHARLS